MKIRNILRYIGTSLLMVSALMLVSGLISLYYGGDDSMMPLFYSALITATVGGFPFLFTSRVVRLSVKEGYFVVVGAWLCGSLFGMLPFLMYGGEFSFANSFFETVSGFTTTGASILNDIESLPRGLLFWRMATSWVGGIGIVTLFSMLIPNTAEKSVLTSVEISGMASDNGGGGKRLFVQHMFIVYVAITAITAVALKLAGMGWFDAVANAMSACSTCGFCTKNASIAAFQSPLIEYIIIIAMTLAALNFSLLFVSMLKGNHARVFKSETVRCFLGVALVSSLIITVNLLVSGDYNSFEKAFRAALFQVCSISSTTGFATADTTLWPGLSIFIIILCSFFCGCSGSTSGGMKIDRAVIAGKAIRQHIVNLHNPHGVTLIKVNGNAKPKEMVYDVFQFIVCYLVIVVSFAVVNLICGQDLPTSVTASIACMGNVGPGFGEVGSCGNYAEFPAFIKFTSAFEMLLGRLEIFPMLYFLGLRKD